MLRARGLCAGLAAAGLFVTADTDRITAASEQSRTIAFKHIHTNETLTIIYKRDGKYDGEALKKINWIMRDWRENKAIEMDPQTIDLLWEMHTELGSKSRSTSSAAIAPKRPTRCCATRSAGRPSRAST